jgi:hypothetical protein
MPNPGDLLAGRYRVLERLGSGGMATVHRARDERLERDVAVKVLLPNLAGDPATAARFEREARSLAASTHPGVVAVFDVDAGDPQAGREPFFVMELCRGGSLADRLGPDRPMAPDDLIPILVPIADGLADLHRRGVVHRDIKPQNILFGDDRAKLADFGLAQSNDGEGVSELTTPGTTVGTLAYLAPELLAGDRATPATDVYALGVVTFVALTGRSPRPGSSMAELVGASGTPAPAVSTLAPDLGLAFDEIVGSALAVDPDDRPDALAFASGLGSALGRWTRDGGPARQAASQAPAASAAPLPLLLDMTNLSAGDGSLVGVGRAPAGDRALVNDATTAIAIPVGATASIALDAGSDRGPARSESPTEPGRTAPWLGRLIVAGALLLVGIAVLAGLLGSGPRVGAGSPASSPTSLPSPSAASASPSIRPSPSAGPASPSPNPAQASLDAMDAAIAAARGGPDGLKGKDANDLENRTAEIRRALDSGDEAAALDLARKLDHRVADLAKNLGADQAARLRSASQDLVRALGG